MTNDDISSDDISSDDTNNTATVVRAQAEEYFRAWGAKDFDSLRGLLAHEATFDGPLGTASTIDECLRGLQGLGQLITDIEISHMWVDGNDVITWFVLSTSVAEPTRTVNWSHFENGKITAINVAFDPRALLAGMDR